MKIKIDRIAVAPWAGAAMLDNRTTGRLIRHWGAAER